MADDPASAAASRSSSTADEDDEGTDSDGSNNSDPAAPQEPPALPDNSAPPPAPEPAGPIPPPPPSSQPQGATAAAAATEESRQLFQRLWTDEEELLIVRGFLEFTSRQGTAFASHQYDTVPFYEEIRHKLSFEFSKNQLIEKLRRLKKKYRVCANRMVAQGGAFAFKSAHDGAIYDVARHIWYPSFKHNGGDASDEDDVNPAEAAAAATALPVAVEEGGGGSASAPTPRGRGGRRGRRRTAQEMETPTMPATPALMLTDIAQEPAAVSLENSVPMIAPPPRVLAHVPAPVRANGPTEEDVRSILSPLLKELISSVAIAGQTGLGLGLGFGFGGVGSADILGPGFGPSGLNPGVPSEEKWRQQQILELEVYLKRIELVREQVATALDELRSSES